MTPARRVGIQVGLVGGLIFFLHALIPYSRAFPFIWPFVTGAVAAWRATKDDGPHRARHGMSAVGIAGVMVGAVTVVGLMITLVTIRRTILDLAPPRMGTGVISATAMSFVMISLLSVVATWIGGVVVLPLRRGHGPAHS